MSKFSIHPSWLPEGIPLPVAESESCFLARESGADRKLNEEQSAATETLSGRHLIQAGAGTGKSTCLVARVRRIPLEYPKARAILISFTKKSAEDLRERIGHLPGVTVSTFHSLAYHILRSAGWNFTVLPSGAAQESVIRKLIGKASVPMGDVLASLHREKAEEKEVQRVREKYLSYLRKQHAVTFDTMQIFALEVLQKDSKVLEGWRKSYDFWLVDEFQDLDGNQLALVRLLAGACGNITAVGDQRQSIYSFRGAVPHGMEEFSGSASCYDLTVNFRSNPAILWLANRIMQEHKPLVAAFQEEAPRYPQYLVSADSDEEARRVAEEIQRLHKAGMSYRDMAVLYRSSSAASRMFEELLERDIPFSSKSAALLRYSEQPYPDVIRIFSFLLAPDSTEALRDLLPMLYLRRNRWKEVLEISERESTPLLSAIRKLRVPFFHQEYLERMTDALETAAGDPPSAALRRIVKGGYGKYVGKAMLPAIEGMAEELEGFSSIEDFLRHVSEIWERMKAMQEHADEDSVRLMTIHASKGMEFRTVFLIGCYDGCLPSEREGADPEEERRLLYVAVTRAKDRLYISYPKISEKNNETNEVSRFLREAFSVSWKGA